MRMTSNIIHVIIGEDLVRTCRERNKNYLGFKKKKRLQFYRIVAVFTFQLKPDTNIRFTCLFYFVTFHIYLRLYVPNAFSGEVNLNRS